MAEMNYLSYTRLKTYGCPFRFQKVYLEEVPDPSGEAALVGKELHRLIRDALIEDYPIVEVGEGRPGDDLPPMPEHIGAAEDLFAQWFDSFDMGGMDPIGIEVRAEGLLNDLTPFRGYLDLACDWQGMLVITDWKSSRWMPSSLDNDPQLGSYAWLASEKWPEYADRDILLRQYYVRFGRYLEAKITRVGRSNVYYTLSRFAERLKAADATTEWPAQPCDQCAYCILWCPLGGKVLRPPQLQIDAQLLAAQAFALGEQYGVARDALKVWCSAHGEVTAAGRTWGIQQSEKPSCPVNARELWDRYHEQLGDDIWSYLSVTGAVLKNPPAGLEIGTRMGEARFSNRKAKA